MTEYEAINLLLAPFIESALEDNKYSTTPSKCKGMIEFKDILKETGRSRITKKLIDQYIKYIQERGILATSNEETRTINFIIDNVNAIVLTPEQMKIKNANKAHYLKYYGS